MLLYAPDLKRKALRIIKDVGVGLSFIWAMFNGWNNHNLYIESQKDKDVIIEQKNSLSVLVENQRKSMSTFITNQSNRSVSLDKLPTATWYKILEGDTFIVLFVNKAYQNLMPSGMSRFELFGRTGSIIDIEFGKIYQENDWKAAYSKDPIIVIEPYYENGKVAQGRFMKWRDWENMEDVVVFGMFIEKAK